LSIQHHEPQEGTADWLPAPAERFFVVLRLYDPAEACLTGDFELPGIERVE